MGGTFPVLSRFIIRVPQERGTKIAGLYSINTAGAMVGTLFVYSFGLPVLGFSRTLLFGVVLNLGIGMLCVVFDRHLESLGFRTPSKGTVQRAVGAEAAAGNVRWLLVAFGLSGFSAMVYEVAWTRALSLVLGSSIYAFCIILATFLGGIALGSGVMRHDLRHRPARLAQFIGFEVCLGLYGLFSIPLFNELPQWFVTLWPVFRGSFAGLSALQLVLSAAVMIFPTVLMGMLFPIVSDLVTGRFAQLGRQLGSAYAINTVGGIIGSFLSGFVMIPVLGLPGAMVVACLVNLLAGGLLYVREGRATFGFRVAAVTSLLVGVALVSQRLILPMWQRQAFAAGVYLTPESYQQRTVAQANADVQLLYYRDSLNATVSVHQQGETVFLKVGGKTDASTGTDMGTQVLSAHIPMLLHKHPERALVIGLGSGVTLGHVGRYPVSTMHCAEIDPAVVEGARYFKTHNYDVHHDPRARIFVADGRNFLLASPPSSYDVIISEPSNPWMAGLAYLFTREFYRLAKQRLASGGLMCQWLQLYRMFPLDVKLVLKTFHEEFPYVSVWSTIPGDLLLVGSMEPQQTEYPHLARQMADPNIRESLQLVQIDRPEVLLRLFWFSHPELETLTSDISWLHEDDQPLLEFSAPKALFVGQTLAANYQGLEQFSAQPQAIARGYDPAREDAAFYQALGRLFRFRLQDQKAKEALERAVELDPTSAETWTQLGELYVLSQEYLKAQVALTKAIERSPTHREAYRLLARVNWQQHRVDEAARWYEQAARAQVPDAPLAKEIGLCLQEAKQPSWAAEYFRSAISQGGGSDGHLLAAYADVLKELKAWPLAEQVLRVGMEAFPLDAGFPLQLGEVLLQDGRLEDAEGVFHHALTIEPKHIGGYYGLGRIAFGAGRLKEAARLLQRGLQFAPYHAEALNLLRQVQLAAHRT